MNDLKWEFSENLNDDRWFGKYLLFNPLTNCMGEWGGERLKEGEVLKLFTLSEV